MKGTLILFCCLFSGILFSQDRTAEFYWLGYSAENEKEIGCSIDPESSTLQIYIEESDSLKMSHLSNVTGVKFKRNKFQEECSNCHKWFSSEKVNKSWKLEKYFTFEATRYDSIDKIQWYKPTFRSEFILNATLAEKTSYLKGLYLKSGRLDSLKIIFSIDESPGKSEATKKLLINLGFKNVVSRLQTIVPEDGIILDNRTILSFNATEEFFADLKIEIDINKTIANIK